MAIPLFPYYIKKEDAKDFAKMQRKMFSVVLLFIVSVILFMQFLIFPKVLNFYKELNESIPLVTQLAPYIMGIIIIVCLTVAGYFLTTPPNYERLEKNLAKYEPKEMIRIKEITQPNYPVVLFILAGTAAVYLIWSIILPIYQLTTLVK